MELSKDVIGTEVVYIPKLETVNNKGSSVLLGFKDSLPVISGKMDSIVDLKKTLKIELSSTGEKFIMVNGKKIKILAESELPKNSQIVKIASLQTVAQSNVKFKILKCIPKIESRISNLPHLNPISTDKKFTSEIARIENKFLKIPVSTAQHIKVNTTDKSGIETDNMKMVKIENKGGKTNIIKLNNFVIGTNKTNQSVQCAALDLTKNCESSMKIKTDAMKDDKCLQVEIKTCNKEVQTDAHDDIDELFENMDILDLLNEKSMTPKRIIEENLDDNMYNINNSSNEYTTLTCIPPKQMFSVNMERTKKEEKFFNELRTALQVDDKGNMPIHIGVLTNNLKLIQRSYFILNILRQNINIPNSNDMTPLQLAIINNSSINIISYLLQEGGKITVTDSEGNNLLHYAVEYERTEALKLLVSHAVKQRFNLDQHNNAGLTPLMLCCLNGYHDCAEILLEADADPNVKDQISGRTALFHASELHDVDMVEMLLQFSACTKIKNFFGTSPHDAMYEIDEMPDAIKFMILGKNKRKSVDDYRPSKFQKNIESNRKVLKTYARLEKITYPDLKKRYSHITT